MTILFSTLTSSLVNELYGPILVMVFKSIRRIFVPNDNAVDMLLGV
jgi:hypothetical protein